VVLGMRNHMAMPKPPAYPGQRRKTKLGSGVWRTLVPPEPDASIPPMPSAHPRRRWTIEAQRAWLAWWSSPMASQWLEADHVALRRALRLVDDTARGEHAGAHTALTQLEDRLGLTPKARRYLMWEARPDSVPASVVSLHVTPAGDPREDGDGLK
jgi:hypothetical protein